MKKFYILILMLLISFTGFSVVNADTTEYFTYETFNGYKYDFTTGEITENELFSITSKMVINRATTNREVTLLNDDFSHMMLFDKNNYLYGYYNTSHTTYQSDKYLGDLSGLTVTIPDDVVSFALMSYNYNVVRNEVAYTYPSIDAIAWEGLTYRDIFEGTNLIDNGYFALDSNSDGLADNFYWTGPGASGVTNTSVTDNTQTWTPLTQYIGPAQVISGEAFIGEHVYFRGDLKTDDVNVRLLLNDGVGQLELITSGSNEFETVSGIRTLLGDVSVFVKVQDNRSGAWTPISLKNLYSYNLTNIFSDNGYSVPNNSQMDSMLDYYEKYKNVSEDVLTYSDIFGAPTRYGGANNLISNGDFNDNSVWTFTNESVYDPINKKGHLQNPSFTYTQIHQNISPTTLYTTNLYYFTFEISDYISGNASMDYFNIGIVNSNGKYSYLMSPTLDTTQFYIKRNVSPVDLKFDNVMLFDLTTIFDVSDEDITTTQMNTWFDVWSDPAGDYAYSSYFTAGQMSTNVISYQIRANIPPRLDVEATKDDLFSVAGLDNIYVTTLLTVILMISITILIGTRGGSTQVILVANAGILLMSAYFGYISYVVIVIIILVIILMLGRSILKG